MNFAKRNGRRIGVMRPAHPEVAIKAGAFAAFSQDARLFTEGLPKEPGPYTFVGWLALGNGGVIDYQGREVARLEPGDSFVTIAHEGKSIPSIGQVQP